MIEIPANTMPINGQLLSPFTLELLSNDAAECLQFQLPDGFLVKVLPPEQDLGTSPHELQTLITLARDLNKEWLHISNKPAGFAYQYQYHQ